MTMHSWLAGAECSLVDEACLVQAGALKIPGRTADLVLVRMPTVPGLTGLVGFHISKHGGGCQSFQSSCTLKASRVLFREKVFHILKNESSENHFNNHNPFSITVVISTNIPGL